jgi:hypothetical protein
VGELVSLADPARLYFRIESSVHKHVTLLT